jgi:NAD-dependent SIR2 family protein deacetylase
MSNYSVQIKKLKSTLDTAEAVIVGAGAGLSTSAGLTYDGERFQKHFADFIDKYRFHDMYSAGFYPYPTPEEYWAYWSRHIFYNRYEPTALRLYLDLFELLKSKNYFVITTNVDHQFQLAGFDKNRLFYTQGDYGLFQCSVPCHRKTYDNEETLRRMIAEQRNMCVPTELLPSCPKCGKPITINLRCDDKFVEDKGWYEAQQRYADFLKTYANSSVLFLELGVGGNTPGIIKYPFWKMTYQNPKAVYCCINLGEAVAPEEINEQSICIDRDIGMILNELKLPPI